MKGKQAAGLSLLGSAEAAAPGGPRHGEQLVGIPLAQLDQQMAQGAVIAAQVQGREALAQGRSQFAELDPAAGQLFEQLQALAMVWVEARSRRLAAPQQLQPGPLLLLDQGLAAPIAAQVAQLRTTAGFNLPLAQAKPALASHQGQPAGRDLGRPSTTAHQVGEIAYPNSLIRFQQQEPGCAPGATLGTGPFDGRRIQGPGLCPKLQGRSSGTAQGAEQLQLALRQQLGFGLEANPQAGLAALQALHDGQLGCVGLQHADQVAVVEGWGGQRISPLDSRMAAGPRSGPA